MGLRTKVEGSGRGFWVPVCGYVSGHDKPLISLRTVSSGFEVSVQILSLRKS